MFGRDLNSIALGIGEMKMLHEGSSPKEDEYRAETRPSQLATNTKKTNQRIISVKAEGFADPGLKMAAAAEAITDRCLNAYPEVLNDNCQDVVAIDLRRHRLSRRPGLGGRSDLPLERFQCRISRRQPHRAARAIVVPCTCHCTVPVHNTFV